MLYDKVSTDLRFVDREKAVENFWKEKDIFSKSITQKERVRPIPSTTALLPQTVSLISDTYLPVS